MIELSVTYKGGGCFEAATPKDHQTCMDELQQGETVWIKITRPRSIEQHNLFFGALHALYQNQERFRSEERLRAVSLIEAGWSKDIILIDEVMPDRNFLRALVGPAPHVVVRPDPDGILMQVPESQAFQSMEQAKFDYIFKRVKDYWMKEFGFDVKAWAKMKKEGAIAA